MPLPTTIRQALGSKGRASCSVPQLRKASSFGTRVSVDSARTQKSCGRRRRRRECHGPWDPVGSWPWKDPQSSLGSSEFFGILRVLTGRIQSRFKGYPPSEPNIVSGTWKAGKGAGQVHLDKEHHLDMVHMFSGSGTQVFTNFIKNTSSEGRCFSFRNISSASPVEIPKSSARRWKRSSTSGKPGWFLGEASESKWVDGAATRRSR